MDFILLIVGLVLLFGGATVSTAITDFLTGIGWGDYSTVATLLTPIAGGFVCLAAIAGKRVFM